MALTPDITNPLGPGILPIVLADQRFGQRGYLWGNSGGIWYCFINPQKLNFDIWQKEIAGWSLAVPIILGVLAGLITGNIGIGILWAFESLVLPLLIVKHYANTGEAQNAPVVTNGPQMELPGNMQFTTVAAISATVVLVPTVAGGIIGAFFAGITLPVIGAVPGWVIGALGGLLTGANLLGLFLFILGWLATPFGSVFGLSFTETKTPPVASTYHFGRSGTGFAAHKIGPLNPVGLVPGSGGLTAMIVGGSPATALVAGSLVGSIYTSLVWSPRPVVTWGLIPFDATIDGFILQTLESAPTLYDGAPPQGGLILVAGSEAWGSAETAALIAAGVKDCVATDGSQSAMLGSQSDWVIGDPSIFNFGSYRDPIQRYGFKAA